MFHWPPAELDRMSLSELMTWRELAVQRWNTAHGSKET